MAGGNMWQPEATEEEMASVHTGCVSRQVFILQQDRRVGVVTLWGDCFSVDV